ncbi:MULTISPECIES: hypothetical protein [Xanthobacter]|uniref:hypothetical protein n=1 Tax=Xanthobacter TaxID=279 RepID=UPI001F164788|nr:MULTISPECIES: hypothetical protein [unclassified Xanthobacter]
MLAKRIFRACGGTALAGLGLAVGLGAAGAEPLPFPSADFSLKANLPRGTIMDMAYSQGKMRIAVNNPDTPGSMVGIIDLTAHRMIMQSPQMPKVAVEIALPPEYVVGALAGTGTKGERSEVAGEPCNLWQVDPPADRKVGPTQACITDDGIALRTEAEIKGTNRVLYEVTSLTRGPQDPKLFQVPPGVKVMKMPQGKFGSILGKVAPAQSQ